MEIKNLLKLPNIFFGLTQEQIFARILGGKPAFETSEVSGQFAALLEDKGHYYLLRDRLGLNKLFYHLDPATSKLTIGNFIEDLAKVTKDYNHIYSVPPGHYLKIDSKTAKPELHRYYDISKTVALDEKNFNVDQFQKSVSSILEKVFQDLQRKFPTELFIVCLSGGLDSSLIASYAKKYLKNVKAVTFSFQEEGSDEVSEDFQSGSAIANALGLEFVPILSRREFSVPMLDKVLMLCQDWRDFNVHCAWLNRIIGQKVREAFPKEKLVFLTGDLMNEYVADYTPVDYKGVTYYPQPKVPKDFLRRFFVFGLDTSDREIGIFSENGITTVQPYAAVAEKYLEVPEAILVQKGCKELLNLKMIHSPNIESLIVKKKVRAQVGGKEGGTLALFHNNNFSQDGLKARWDQIFAKYSREEKLAPMIVSGQYRKQTS